MKIIVFDIDGTLTDTTRVDDLCFFAAFKKTFGLDVQHMDWDSFPHVTDTAITAEILRRRLCRVLSAAELERMKHAFMEALDSEWKRDPSQFQPVPGAKEYVDKLRARPDVQLGIATGSWKDSGLFKLARIGMDISDLAYSNSDRHSTRTEICLDAIEQAAQSEPWTNEQVTYYGDGLWDMRTCAEIGVRFIGVDAHGNGKLKAEGVEVVLQDYSVFEQ